MAAADRDERAPRFPCWLPVELRGAEGVASLTAVDVSISGAYLAGESAPPQRDALELQITSYLSHEPVRMACRVARTGTQPRPGIGVAFTDVPPQAAQLLLHYHQQFKGAQRMVMVDDEPTLLRMMERFAERAGLGFIGVEHPDENVDEILRFRPNIIVLDLMMPKVSGITLARGLRESGAAQGIPLVFYSALESDQVPEDLRDIPFLQKGSSGREAMVVFREHMMRAIDPRAQL